MARRIAIEAGHATLAHFDESGYAGAETKGDGSPVTVADREAEEIIGKKLKDILPDIPIIGEEAAEAGNLPDLSGADYFWLVDPLDGTKEFISGSGDYTVNIALIHIPPSPLPSPHGGEGDRAAQDRARGEPVLGVVYAPVKGELYAGCGEGTAIRWLEDTNAEKVIHVRRPPKEGLTVVASRNHGDGGRLNAFLDGHKVEKLIKRGSSLKICAVAAGKADLYPRFGPTCEWDTAAGDAILRAAGGVLAATGGQPFTYGHAERKFLNPEFIAAPTDFFSDSIP